MVVNVGGGLVFMSVARLVEVTKHLTGALQNLETEGIRVEIGDDFAKYRGYRHNQAGRGPVYPMFDIASSFIDHTNGFWICGFDDSDKLIHTQAVRLFDLSDTTLGGHLDLHRHKYITPDSTPDPDQTFYAGPDVLDTITGKVAYQGDFWLPARGLGGPRSQGATALLSRVLLEITIAAWNPAFVFAFVPKQLALKGVHLRYGYWHCAPGQWIGPDQQITDEDSLIWMSAKDMQSTLALAPQKLQPAPRSAGQRSQPAIATPGRSRTDVSL